MRDIDLGRAVELALFAIEATIKNRLCGVVGQQFFPRDGTDRSTEQIGFGSGGQFFVAVILNERAHP